MPAVANAVRARAYGYAGIERADERRTRPAGRACRHHRNCAARPDPPACGRPPDSRSWPRQKAWLTVTLPAMPCARVRSTIMPIVNSPSSPGSCKWMSIGLPCFSASPKIVSRWPFGSLSIDEGSRPPTTSAPSRQRLVHEFHRARPDHHAGLRESDDLDVDEVLVVLARRHHALDALQTVNRVDIDVAADMGRAARDRERHLAGRLARRIEAELRLHLALIGRSCRQGCSPRR